MVIIMNITRKITEARICSSDMWQNLDFFIETQADSDPEPV
jgi:hypothetical protein